MRISYKLFRHTLVERGMGKEDLDLGLAAGLAANMITNMSKEGKKF